MKQLSVPQFEAKLLIALQDKLHGSVSSSGRKFSHIQKSGTLENDSKALNESKG